MARPNLFRIHALAATAALLIAMLPSAAAQLEIGIPSVAMASSSCPQDYQSGHGTVYYVEGSRTYTYSASGTWTNGCGGKGCDDHVSAHVFTRSGDYFFVAQEVGTAGNCVVKCSISQDVIATNPSVVQGDYYPGDVNGVQPYKTSSGYAVHFACMNFYTLPSGTSLSFYGSFTGGRPADEVLDLVPEIMTSGLP